ncbi:hypothetical protein R5R35_004146 [Gryllus longicercus]|uniref:Accessory gland protein n=1 Tax=Gryllus longicercus TaxID=2509291 RepID=A0AAN9V2H0_9ORTH
MLRFVLLVSVGATATAFPQRFEGESVTDASDNTTCGYYICGKNAICSRTKGYDECLCKPGFYGAAYGSNSVCTSEPECIDDSGCDDDKSCNRNNLCVNPCFYKCMDVGCEVKKHVAKCIYDGHLFWEPYVQATTPPSEGSSSEPHVQPTSPENEESSPQRQ